MTPASTPTRGWRTVASPTLTPGPSTRTSWADAMPGARSNAAANAASRRRMGGLPLEERARVAGRLDDVAAERVLGGRIVRHVRLVDREALGGIGDFLADAGFGLLAED